MRSAFCANGGNALHCAATTVLSSVPCNQALSDSPTASASIKPPPRGAALLLAIGPAIVWCAEYIGSGEVILATRTGAILGTGILWAVVVGVFLKYLIGLGGGWYTVTTGESMIDMFARLPRVGYAALCLVFVAQLAASVLSIGSLAASAGVFLAELLPVKAMVAGWAVTIAAVAVAWYGEFQPLKLVMSVLVSITLLGVAVISFKVLPSASEFLAGLVPHVPDTPDWAVEAGASTNAWSEVLPLLGWGAGGFASQVWYTYWIMGAGYGAAAGRRQGLPADEAALGALDSAQVDRLVGWRRVITMDATAAMVVGVLATLGFLLAGAAILGTRQLAPEGPEVALTLATLFGAEWGERGAFLFLIGGAAALISTQFAQVAGWPYLLDDALRHLAPGYTTRLGHLTRRRLWLCFYLIASMVIVYSLGFQPVTLVRFAAVAEGLVLTPIQALAVLFGLYWVMPRMFSPEMAQRVKVGPWIGGGLLVSFVVFSYFCVAQLPAVLMGK